MAMDAASRLIKWLDGVITRKIWLALAEVSGSNPSLASTKGSLATGESNTRRLMKRAYS